MKISEKDVERISKMAKLDLTVEERAKMAEQLGKILDYMKKLNELNTENIEPTFHVLPVQNIFREDRVTDLFQNTDLMANAPKRELGHYQVPKILGS